MCLSVCLSPCMSVCLYDGCLCSCLPCLPYCLSVCLPVCLSPCLLSTAAFPWFHCCQAGKRSIDPFVVEREENVKTDIFAAYCALLSSTKIVVTTQQSGAVDAMETADNPLSLLATQVPSIVKALSKQMKERSLRTRQGCFTLFTSLVTILPGALDSHMDVIIPGVLFSLTYVVCVCVCVCVCV